MNNEIAYIYTGDVMIDSSEVGTCTIDGLYSFYNYLEGVIAKKLGVSYEAVELCKFSCDPEKDFIKANYKLHYTVATNAVRSAVYSALDEMKLVKATDVNFKATGNRRFNIEIDVVTKSNDRDAWKNELNPAKVEVAASLALPRELIPVVTFNVSYPVTTMASVTIESESYDSTH